MGISHRSELIPVYHVTGRSLVRPGSDKQNQPKPLKEGRFVRKHVLANVLHTPAASTPLKSRLIASAYPSLNHKRVSINDRLEIHVCAYQTCEFGKKTLRCT